MKLPTTAEPVPPSTAEPTPPSAQFSLFSPDVALPTEERTQFRARANDIFADLTRGSVPDVTRDAGPSMLPPPAPPANRNRVRFTVDTTDATTRDSGPSRKRSFNGDQRNNMNKGVSRQPYRSQHELAPERFTKYSLEDTDIADDRNNKTIALNYINSLKGQSEDTSTSNVDNKEDRIVFRKREKEKSPERKEEAPRCSTHIHVQAEYVIGQTKSSSNRQSKAKRVQTDKPTDKHKRVTPVAACYMDDCDAS